MLRWAMIAVATLLASGAAATASAQETISLEDAVRLAREESPTSRALRARIAVADAEIDLAGVYPNPTLSYGTYGRFDGGDNAINGTQHQVWVDVPLLIGGQHDARRSVASAEALAARAELDLALLDLEIDARRAFNALLAAQERLARLESARADLDRIRGIVEVRESAGAQSRYDGARIAIELARLDVDRSVARAEARAASGALAALLARPDWAPRADGSLEAHARSEAVSLEDLPSVRAARARVEAAERDVHRADVERIPELALGLGTYFTTDPDSSSVFASVSVPLPIFDTGEAAVRRARAARDAAVEAQSAIEVRAQARLDAALALLDARRAAIAAFDSETAARLPELLQMAEASYRLGASGIFELLDTFRARLDLELSRIELLEAAIGAEIDVLAAAGS
jgi:cobalt-zinc-cadmium efflux system outer membrane protein